MSPEPQKAPHLHPSRPLAGWWICLAKVPEAAWRKVNPDVTVAPGWAAKAASGIGEGRALLHRAAAWKLFSGVTFLLSSANKPIPFNLLHPQRVCDLWVTSCLNGMPASSAAYVGAAERGCASLAPCWLGGSAALGW